ncbi:MAG TPA: hypothetical protein VM715_06775 [Candidatus Acidoferrum sp.]|nr:hypothetical protein [Candidatus Acidoferrum sp.]
MKRTILTIAAAIFAGATAFNMGVAVQDIIYDHNEPQGVYQNTCDAECMQSWITDTDEEHGTPNQYPMPPLDADGMPMTNPCPWQAAQEGICTW